MNNTLDIDENALVSSLTTERLEHLALGLEMNFHIGLKRWAGFEYVIFEDRQEVTLRDMTVSQLWAKCQEELES